jgi:hypothetical protein
MMMGSSGGGAIRLTPARPLRWPGRQAAWPWKAVKGPLHWKSLPY